MRRAFLCLAITGSFILPGARIGADEKAGPNDNMPPPGFSALFNGKDLTNWQGLVELPDRKKLTAEQLAAKQEEANKKYLPHWTVKDGILNYDGKGQSLQT